ncbi:butyrate kinase [Vagococcus zengguangii]|uniref:Probable butyrate kinase n=1 Tax=Vagococcus zengguangii TaxID=2571750 RepID=A0A4D7CRI4_9ENTE|nr:butyrate kinase [Vagococcus zengguangii]QCI86669.1 butyrate kinase [Vagococcus zengguangii]TLG78289.1 butyrate kinase [Vagococcus zengguangii]
MNFETLVINPGSTSTKVAVYQGKKQLFQTNLCHPIEEIEKYPQISDQFDFRTQAILKVVEEQSYDLNRLSAVVGRGGLLRPIESGTYEVTEKLKEDLRLGVSGQHACNLGGLIADEIAQKYQIPSYIVDPVVVDELQPLARFSGTEALERSSIFHALNHKAVGRIAAEKQGTDYDKQNYVIAHLGGGVSVASHEKGRVVDVNNALGGEGPFSPERAGGVPVYHFMQLTKEWPQDKIYKTLVGKGGLVSYLGTNDLRVVEQLIAEGDQKAKLVFDAMAYQISKEIGANCAVLKGKIDAIVLTGGLCYSDSFVQSITEYVSWMAPIIVVPGEDEMGALNQGAQRVLAKIEHAKQY